MFKTTFSIVALLYILLFGLTTFSVAEETYYFYILELEVANQKTTGKSWDQWKGAPDLRVDLYLQKNYQWEKVRESNLYRDLYEVRLDWNTGIELSWEEQVRVRVLDKDFSNDDLIADFQVSLSEETLEKEQETTSGSVSRFVYLFSKYPSLEEREEALSLAKEKQQEKLSDQKSLIKTQKELLAKRDKIIREQKVLIEKMEEQTSELQENLAKWKEKAQKAQSSQSQTSEQEGFIEELKLLIQEQKQYIAEKKQEVILLQDKVAKQEMMIKEQQQQLARLNKQLDEKKMELSEHKLLIQEQLKQLEKKDQLIAEQKKKLTRTNKLMADLASQMAKKDRELRELQEQLGETSLAPVHQRDEGTLVEIARAITYAVRALLHAIPE